MRPSSLKYMAPGLPASTSLASRIKKPLSIHSISQDKRLPTHIGPQNGSDCRARLTNIFIHPPAHQRIRWNARFGPKKREIFHLVSSLCFPVRGVRIFRRIGPAEDLCLALNQIKPHSNSPSPPALSYLHLNMPASASLQQAS